MPVSDILFFKMIKLKILTVLFALICSYSNAQSEHFEVFDLDSLLNVQKRHVVFFVHTNWCKICHRMEQTTFKNQEVLQELSDNFYFVYVNAEDREEIVFKGTNYLFVSRGPQTGFHEFAMAIGAIDGKLAYPTISILNTEDEIVFKNASYMDSSELLTVLRSAAKLNN